MTRTDGVCVVYIGDEILPSCRGIILSHKDPYYEPARISWNVKGFVAVAQFVFQAEMMQPQGLCWCWQQLHWKLWTLLQLGMTFEAGERETNHSRNQHQSSLHEGSIYSSLFFWGLPPRYSFIFFWGGVLSAIRSKVRKWPCSVLLKNVLFCFFCCCRTPKAVGVFVSSVFNLPKVTGGNEFGSRILRSILVSTDP